MAYSRPNSRYRCSLLNRRLLCGLALIAGSTLGGAQEPQGDAGPDAFDADVLDVEARTADGDLPELVARLEVELLLTELVDQARFEEAVPIAERMVELTEEESGVSIELGIALSNLAILQRSLELYEPSERNFVRAVDVIREADGAYSEAAISPLVGLGMNYQARGDYFEAETTYEEARTVSRRAHGLLNEQQIDILDHLASTMMDMQRYVEADEYQLTALHLMERIHGADMPGVLPAIYKFARWLRSAYRFQEERGQYVRAMDIIRDYEGATSQAMVRPLRETGISYRTQKLPEGRGLSALRRALEIAENQPAPDTRLIAETLVDIGDWNVAFSKVGATGEEYRRAWQLLGELADGDALRGEWFNDPIYVLRENPSSRGIGSPNDPGALPGHVLITFDVTEFGRTVNVTVVESVPPGLKDDSTARAIGRSRFRPRMVDGELVRAPGLARNFTFHYQPEE
ncbi:MAG: tetratricopeptide repeat protein [Gammaproteobacteria bacterium]